MNLRSAAALTALCLVFLAGGYSGYLWWHARPAAEPPQATTIRPDLEFKGLDGQVHKLSEWDGKLLLLNFWATWCTPCLKEIPLLVQAQQDHGARGFQIVGLALDKVELVKPYAERLKINYPLMVGDEDIIYAMDALGDELGAFPFSVLIAPDGRVLERISGDISREELQAWLDKYLV